MATKLNTSVRFSPRICPRLLAGARGLIARDFIVVILPTADGFANHSEVLASDPERDGQVVQKFK